jgi:hypothetical protein
MNGLLQITFNNKLITLVKNSPIHYSMSPNWLVQHNPLTGILSVMLSVILSVILSMMMCTDLIKSNPSSHINGANAYS